MREKYFQKMRLKSFLAHKGNLFCNINPSMKIYYFPPVLSALKYTYSQALVKTITHLCFTSIVQCIDGLTRCPEVNKFEQVSSLIHQMSLAGGSLYSEVHCLEGRQCTMRSNASWVIVTWHPSPLWTDRYDWKKTLPSHNFVGGP